MPLAEHDEHLTSPDTGYKSFNSRAPRGARRCRRKAYRPVIRFNSRAPRGARLHELDGDADIVRFQFTCPSRSTTPGETLTGSTRVVSIHVPLAEHDTTYACSLLKDCMSVSIHVPLAEHDRCFWATCLSLPQFQFTCPSRSTTDGLSQHRQRHFRFNSRAPRGARRSGADCALPCRQFQFTCPSRSTTHAERPWSPEAQVSIHVPLAEHDMFAAFTSDFIKVSIHVPLAEHDGNTINKNCPYFGFNSRAPRGARLAGAGVNPAHECFNSRAPRGARRTSMVSAMSLIQFQFTCPSRSTTFSSCKQDISRIVSIHVPLAEHDVNPACSIWPLMVSIHVPLAEHDSKPRGSPSSRARFNSRAPRGARLPAPLGRDLFIRFQFTCPSRSTTMPLLILPSALSVSIHVPLAEHDDLQGGSMKKVVVSIHVPLAEHDQGGARKLIETLSFNSRAPRGARRSSL